MMELIGILNVTPDSFSDGGKWLAPKDAISHAMRLLEEGASIIEVGGDSTRPGSICVGEDKEWRRIGEVVREVSKFCKVCVDTHHKEVAARALDSGAWMINDIFGGRNLSLLETIKRFSSRVVLMASRLTNPHTFGTLKEPALSMIASFLKDAVLRAKKAGLGDSQVVLDTGMGAFISDDPEDSWRVIRNYEKFNLGFPLLLGVSRKGFLKVEAESSILDRDIPSFYAAMEALKKANFSQPIYLRVHNVKLHRDLMAESMLDLSLRPE